MTGTVEGIQDSSPPAVARWHGSLSALLPEGWLAEEVIQIRAPDGSVSVNVAAGPTPQSLDELVERYGMELARLPGYSEVSLETAVVMGGRNGTIRTFTWDAEDGTRVVQLQSYVVEGDTGFVATASASPNVFEVRRDLMLGLLQSIETTPRSFEVSSGSEGLGPDGALAMFLAGVSQIDDIGHADASNDWSETAGAWRSERPSANSTADVDLSADELEALAQLYGFDTFPGVGQHGFHRFSTETRLVAGRGARRSLLAHGVVRITESGAIAVEPTIAAMLRVALEPALVVTHERQSGEGQVNTILLADPEILVEHVQLVNGSHRLSSHPASSLFARLTDRLEMSDNRPEFEESHEISIREVSASIEEGRMVSEEIPVRPLALHLVTATHQENDKLAGGWLGWFLDDEGQMWRLESSDNPSSESRIRVVAMTKSELEDEMFSYLPGGGS